MTSLTSLIERIEAATEGSRELDHAIHYHTVVVKSDRFTEQSWVRKAIAENWNTPRYSASIDAALTLLPEGWWLTLDRYCISDKAPDPFAWRVWLKRLVGDVDGDGSCGTLRFFATGSTAPLALLAAILRARQTEARCD